MEAPHRILFNEQTIAQRVAELAQDISNDYAGKEVVAVCILKGALVFFTDLVRRISVPVFVDFIQASSYGPGSVSSMDLVISKDTTTDIRGKHVLLIDTIIDTGETMACLYKRFSEQGPASLAIVGLLDKKPRRTAEVPISIQRIRNSGSVRGGIRDGFWREVPEPALYRRASYCGMNNAGNAHLPLDICLTASIIPASEKRTSVTKFAAVSSAEIPFEGSCTFKPSNMLHTPKSPGSCEPAADRCRSYQWINLMMSTPSNCVPATVPVICT